MIRSALLAAALMGLAACGPSAPSATGSSAAPAPSAELTPDEITARVAALPAPYNEGDYANGRRVAAQCRSCHTFTADGGNRVGPNLHGLFGRPVGTAPDFNYSDAVKNAGFAWDDDHLDHWLTNPRTFLPGNRMSFPGVPNEKDRHDLITFLQIETAR